MAPLATNRKAFFDYEILEKFEAGIILLGCEVKSCRQGKINLKGSHLSTNQKDIFIEKMHISPYQPENQKDYEPLRKRKILLKEKEIKKIIGKLNEKGISGAPLEMYLKGNLIKVEIALCKGKKKYDKRETIKKRETERMIKKSLKN